MREVLRHVQCDCITRRKLFKVANALRSEIGICACFGWRAETVILQEHARRDSRRGLSRILGDNFSRMPDDKVLEFVLPHSGRSMRQLLDEITGIALPSLSTSITAVQYLFTAVQYLLPSHHFAAATPGVFECAFCGKSKVSTSGSVPVFSISTPPFASAACVMNPISG